MSAYEFNQWQIYYRLFPFGDEREDWRMGMICSSTLAPHTKKPPKAQDFMLKPRETEKQKADGLKAAMRRAATSRRGKAGGAPRPPKKRPSTKLGTGKAAP